MDPEVASNHSSVGGMGKLWSVKKTPKAFKRHHSSMGDLFATGMGAEMNQTALVGKQEAKLNFNGA